MAFPEYVHTREVRVGGASILESGQQVKVRLALTASTSLIWEATGFRFEKDAVRAVSSAAGVGVVLELPVTDQGGWRDAETGDRILVDVPDSYTHSYVGTLTIMDETGMALTDVILGPFVLPLGDGSVVDLDLLLPVGSQVGKTVFVPDSWSTFAPAAAASADRAEESAAQAGTSAFNAGASAAAAQSSEQDAIAARNTATAAAGSAGASADAAANSASLAQTSHAAAAESATAADSSSTSASQSKVDAANSAAQAALRATDAADAAADAATQRGQAQTARSGAESARTGAETAQTAAETAQSGAQTARTGAETARTGAETARDLALAGQFAGTSLLTQDLNAVTTPGVYVQGTSAEATLARNYPKAGGGLILEVFRIGASIQVMQRAVILFNANPTAERGYYTRRQTAAGVWSAWASFSAQRIVVAAGQPGVQVLTWDDVNSREQQMLPTVISINATTDLNAITLPGQYYQATAAADSLTRNYPLAGALGVLEVTATTNTLLQEFTPTSSADTTAARSVYRRRMLVSTSAWSAWRVIPTQRIVSPAGQPGANVFTWDEVNAREQGLMPVGNSLGTVNLDLVTVTGIYYQPTGADATLARAYPSAGFAGTLEVFNDGGNGIVQRFTARGGAADQGARVFYERRFQGSTPWQPWRAFTSQRVDQTAGRAIYTWDDVNNREQLLYGDSGWREINTTVTNGWACDSFNIRRIGSVVECAFRGFRGAAATSPTAMPVPVGFRPNGNLAPVVQSASGPYSHALFYVGGGGWTIPQAAPELGAGGVRALVSWTTPDPWPTTLPGVAAGAIPNL